MNLSCILFEFIYIQYNQLYKYRVVCRNEFYSVWICLFCVERCEMSSSFFLIIGEEFKVGAYVFCEYGFVILAYFLHLKASVNTFIDNAKLMYAIISDDVLYLFGVEF